MGAGLQRARAAAKDTRVPFDLKAAIAMAADIEAERNRLRLNDTRIRNIIFNVQQNPKNHTVEEMLENMRRAIGVGSDEKV